MKRIISILSILLILNCKNQNTNSDQKDLTDSLKVEKVEKKVAIEDQKNCNETFEEFFDRFSKDSIFQKSRIKYPLRYLLSDYDYEIEKDTVGIELVHREGYKYFNFSKDKNAIEAEYDKYTIETEKITDSIVNYYWFGYDNGIRVTYKFKLIDGCWYMVEILDEST